MSKITLKHVKRGAKLPPPVYKTKPYVVLSPEGIVLGAGDIGYLQKMDDYFDEFPVKVRQHDLHLNDNTKAKPGRSFECQPDDTEGAVFETHFDCWSDTEDENSEPWEWSDRKAKRLFAKLMVQAVEVTRCKNFQLFNYQAKNQVHAFELVEALFNELGYDTYNSDTMFYAWAAGTVKPSEHEEKPFRPDHRCDGDGTPSNGERAERALRALEAWRGSDRPDATIGDSELQDLISDLMHLAQREGVDFDETLSSATDRFHEEQ